jgi:hypothetical protein
MYGMEAIAYPQFAPHDIQQDLSVLAGTPIYQLGDGTYQYHFFNRNPVHQYSDYLLSNRSIIASATCDQLETKQEDVATTSDTGSYYLDGRHSDTDDWTRFYFPEYAG